MTVNAEQLRQMHIDPVWEAPLNVTFERFDISTPLRQAAFIGQAGHESGNFKMLSENLNYRAETLMKQWPRKASLFSLASSSKTLEPKPKTMKT